MALSGRALAWTNLAWRFGRHVLTRMPVRAVRRGRDAARFRDAVFPEGYLPLTPDERALMPDAMRCIHCGLCALACPTLADAPASAWDEAWTFVAGPSRSIDHAPLIADGPTDCADSAEAAAVCPVGVPIPRMAAMTRRLAATTPQEPT